MKKHDEKRVQKLHSPTRNLQNWLSFFSIERNDLNFEETARTQFQILNVLSK